LRILSGEDVNTIPVQKDQSNRFIFDHLALQHFNIPLSDLPPDSIIKNRQYSVWKIYQPQIITATTSVAILSLLVIFLLIVTRQLNRTRLALVDLNLNLEDQVQERTATLNQTNLLLQDEINAHIRLEDELRHQATTDVLTGISNRRHFLALAQNEINRAQRLNHPLAIALLDIDHFKSINDVYGHAAGDQALSIFVTTCQQNLREIDVLARLGGDEFVILLPETGCDQAYTALERIRKALTAVPFDFAGQPVQITISIDIANLAHESESLDAFLGRADEALYRAKEAGRNQIVIVQVA
jgi:two-component system cell cycle response regulator